jgi:hypothetical protein
VLKQFALRAVSSAVQDARVEFKKGNYVKGIGKASSLIIILGLAGAGTDEIKNILLGREGESLMDSTVGNIMDILFANRYTLEQGMKMGKPLQSLFMNNLMLPPMRAADAVVNDLWKTSQGEFEYKTLSHVPIFGRIAYEHLPMGREAEVKRSRKRIMEQASEGVKFGKLVNEIREFNKSATGEAGLEKITPESFRSARKRAKEEE